MVQLGVIDTDLLCRVSFYYVFKSFLGYPFSYPLQDARQNLFEEFLKNDRDVAKVEAHFQQKLEETQRTQVRYGFRNDQWLIKHHGQRKAEKIMKRKSGLGLPLGSQQVKGWWWKKIISPGPLKVTKALTIFGPTQPSPTRPATSSNVSSSKQPGDVRTIPDPEFPGEPDELLYFVMVELNMDDIKELRRATALEMQGSLDQDGLKAFVEVPRHDISIECKHTNSNHLMKIHPRYNQLQLFPHPKYALKSLPLSHLHPFTLQLLRQVDALMGNNTYHWRDLPAAKVCRPLLGPWALHPMVRVRKVRKRLRKRRAKMGKTTR